MRLALLVALALAACDTPSPFADPPAPSHRSRVQPRQPHIPHRAETSATASANPAPSASAAPSATAAPSASATRK